MGVIGQLWESAPRSEKRRNPKAPAASDAEPTGVGGCLSNGGDRGGAERRSLAFRPRCQRLPSGYWVFMKLEREMKRERDELDSLAAEAGQSAFLVGMTALMLVMALVLGFAV